MNGITSLGYEANRIRLLVDIIEIKWEQEKPL